MYQKLRWRVNEPDGYTRKMISSEILNRRGWSLLTPEGRPHGRTRSKLGEIRDEESTAVGLLASDTDTVKAGEASSVPDRRQAGPSDNARSSFTASRDTSLVVDLQDGGAVILDKREVLGVLSRLVLDVSVGRVVLGEEIPVTGAT